MPAEAGGPGPRVFADRELEVEARRAEGDGLRRAAAEGPSQTRELAGESRRGRALREDLPPLVEPEAVDRGRREVRLEAGLAGCWRDPAAGHTTWPRHHRVPGAPG